MGAKLKASEAVSVIRSLFALARAVEEALEFHAHPSEVGLDMNSNKLRALMPAGSAW